MKRKDGRKIVEIDSFHRFYTYLMPKRVNSFCWTTVKASATNALKYIEEKKEQGLNITIFQIVISALLRTASLYPELNRFIYGHEFYARNEYSFSFAISLKDNTLFRKLKFEPGDTILEVSNKIQESLKLAVKNPSDDTDKFVILLMKLPKFIVSMFSKVYPWLVNKGLIPLSLLDDDILFSSCMVSFVGTFGINGFMHHLYEWGTTSVFLTVGEAAWQPVAKENGEIFSDFLIDFGFTIDERISSGKIISDSLKFFKRCFEDPWSLEKPLNIQ